MSEDDRAAKAARAKALLAKKRQQKKAAAEPSSTPSQSPTATTPTVPSRTSTPAPVEKAPSPLSIGNGQRDISSVFGQDAGDSSWISSLTPASSPPPRLSPASPKIQSKPPTPIPGPGLVEKKAPLPNANEIALEEKLRYLDPINSNLQAEVKRLQEILTASQKAEALLAEEQTRLRDLQRRYSELEREKGHQLQGERRTIELLVSAKSSLTAELQKSHQFEAKWQGAEEELESERTRSQEVANQLQQLQIEVGEASQRISEYQIKEKDLQEKSRELERQLQRVTAAANDSRKEAEETGRRLQELTEQIQNDDRVEKLEKSLKHSQDRADELEFQLTKLKQTHATLKTEKEQLDSRFGNFSKQETEWTAKVSDLEGRLSSTQDQLSHAVSERDVASKDATSLRSQLEESQTATSELEEKLARAVSAVSAQTRQTQVLQNELKVANRRAEESEKTTKHLQQEGTNLMRSLEEMRPKIVELTDAKLNLAEQVEGLQRALKNRDAAIEKLESSVDELQFEKSEAEKKWQENVTNKEKQSNSAQSELAELKKGYNQVQEDLETALASIKSLEAQRASSHQDASRRLEEIDRLISSAQAQSEEVTSLRRELDARRKAQDEEQEILDRVQDELEGLRSELTAKNEELERLREVVLSPTVDGPRSLDEELLSSIRQQHALEISAAHSQIRALEDTTFEAQVKGHELQKQLTTLQDQVTRLQSGTKHQLRPFSPVPSRPSSRATHDDHRRSSFGSHRPNPPAALSRTVFDQALSPETMHKRKASLSMLKARIDSEVAVAGHSPHPVSRALSPIGDEDTHTRIHHHLPHSHQVMHRPQFLDESHVFWCSSCQGDLVVL